MLVYETQNKMWSKFFFFLYHLYLKNFNLGNLCVFFFQLWEQSQLDNSKLRDDLARTRDELTTAKKKLDTVVQVIHSSLKIRERKRITFKERLSKIMVY